MSDALPVAVRALGEVLDAILENWSDVAVAREIARRLSNHPEILLATLRVTDLALHREAILEFIADRFDIPAEAGGYDASDLVEALEGKPLIGESLHDRLAKLIGLDAFYADSIAEALAAVRVGDTAGADRILRDAFPSADLDALAHVARCKTLFDLRSPS